MTQIAAGSTGNRTYYAKWTAGAYTITYVLDGGTNAAENPTNYTIEDSITLADPTKEGYSFNGWYSDAGFTTKVTEIAKGSTGDITLYAKFTVNTYTVTWIIDGVSSEENYNYGETPVHADPAKEADEQYLYTFIGWEPAVAEVTGDATYTAKFSTAPRTYGEPAWAWTGDGEGGYIAKATFTTNDGGKEFSKVVDAVVTSATTPATCEEAGKTVYTATAVFEGKSYTDVKEETIQATGHKWGEPAWNWSDDFGTATATFICGNDTTHTRTVEANVTTQVTPATAGEPGKTVYTATVVLDGETYTNTMEETLPILNTTYTLTYDANGGDGAPEAQTETNNTLSAVFEVSSAKPTRSNCTFKGWARTADATEPMTETTVTLTYPETSAVLYAVWEEITPRFRTQSLVLSGQIGLNFYLELPDLEGVDYSKSYVEFTVGGKGGFTARDGFDPECKNPTGKYYGFTCYVNSIQMAETITATFHYGDGKTISKEYSIERYILAVDKNQASFDSDTIALTHAIADYGYYSQQYLSKLRGWVIGTDYAEMKTHYTDGYNYDAVKSAVDGYKTVRTYGSSKVTNAPVNLFLDSTTTIDIKLAVSEGSLTAQTTFNGKTYSAELQDDGRYLVRVTGISAHQLGSTIKVTGNAGGSFTVTTSVMAYVRSVLNSSSFDAEAKDDMCSLYAYYAAVMQYRTSH